MADSPEEIRKHIKLYLMVGGALLIATALTVAVAFMQVGEPGLDTPDIIIGLLIATVKAVMVGLIFMHLNHERGLIYKILLFTGVFALAMVVLILMAHFDPKVYSNF
jgi:caa(3)-type oxidase subunit IV